MCHQIPPAPAPSSPACGPHQRAQHVAKTRTAWTSPLPFPSIWNIASSSRSVIRVLRRPYADRRLPAPDTDPPSDVAAQHRKAVHRALAQGRIEPPRTAEPTASGSTNPSCGSIGAIAVPSFRRIDLTTPGAAATARSMPSCRRRSDPAALSRTQVLGISCFALPLHAAKVWSRLRFPAALGLADRSRHGRTPARRLPVQVGHPGDDSGADRLARGTDN